MSGSARIENVRIKVNFPEPCDVEAESVPEFDLRHNVPVTVLLGKPARTRQLVEEAEAHLILPTGDPPDWVAVTRALPAEQHAERKPAIDSGKGLELSAQL
jgi:hypothetical protein